jgi:hypothetical protein
MVFKSSKLSILRDSSSRFRPVFTLLNFRSMLYALDPTIDELWVSQTREFMQHEFFLTHSFFNVGMRSQFIIASSQHIDKFHSSLGPVLMFKSDLCLY